ncbi:MAG: hypothetical protein JMDDDDMK_00451 [Acidobacteria bacterium]|nr:hypothetical protein [Acidobacteriota bacterium]
MKLVLVTVLGNRFGGADQRQRFAVAAPEPLDPLKRRA